SMSGPPFLTHTPFVHALDRRVDLQVEEVGAIGGPVDGSRRELAHDGVAHGDDDLLRGGPGRDVLHGGAGDDIMNGDSGADVLFGCDGADGMGGGRGNPDPDDPDARQAPDGPVDGWIDHLFGGRGGEGTEGLVVDGADVLDYRPRTYEDTGGLVEDPQAW